IDNLRAAFAHHCENHDPAQALRLASSLQPLWQGRGRLREGLAWFEAILGDGCSDPDGVALPVLARALADKAVLDAYTAAADNMEQANRAVAIARELDDPALLARALTACGYVAGLD